MRQFWGSSSKPFKVLMALALLVLTTMQVGAYAQNGTAFFKSPSVAERQLESHLHHANHASANTDNGNPLAPFRICRPARSHFQRSRQPGASSKTHDLTPPSFDG
jgi:hypothetical protein